MEYFEGPEKLLEIWFQKGAASKCPLREDGLRSISKEKWSEMLQIVGCQILSVIYNDQVDAYLLSESSLYVFPQKIILKTCGTTKLLTGIHRLLELAREVGLNSVWQLFYSRKAFLFPQNQCWPHSSWQDEVNFLDSIFNNGSSYIIGRTNGDHWNLYMLEPLPHLPPSFKDDRPLGHAEGPPDDVDQTLEILMTGLDPEQMQLFFLRNNEVAGAKAGFRAQVESDIAKLCYDAELDTWMFAPCGYSLNGIRDDNYVTMHITPEASHSFASLETNIPLSVEELHDLFVKVVEFFRPANLTVTLLKNISSLQRDNNKRWLQRGALVNDIPGWRLEYTAMNEFEHYRLELAQFIRKKPSKLEVEILR